MSYTTLFVVCILFAICNLSFAQTITNPACGDVWYTGKEYEIEFTPQVRPKLVRVETSTGEVIEEVCRGNTCSMTSLTHEPNPQIVNTTNDARIVVYNDTNAQIIIAEHNGCAFSLRHAVSSPKLGDMLYYYQPWLVTWNSSFWDTTDVWLWFGNGGYISVPNNGSYNFYYNQPPPAENVTTPGYYRFMITEASLFSKYRDYSEPFWIGNASPYGYVGCFQYTSTGDDQLKLTFKGNYTTEMCRGICFINKYGFAALSNDTCLCTSSARGSYARFPYLSDAACSTPCPANTSEKCGGPGASTVWVSAMDREFLGIISPVRRIYNLREFAAVTWVYSDFSNLYTGLIPGPVENAKIYREDGEFIAEWARPDDSDLSRLKINSFEAYSFSRMVPNVTSGRYYAEINLSNGASYKGDKFYIRDGSDLAISKPVAGEIIPSNVMFYTIEWTPQFPELPVTLYLYNRRCSSSTRGGTTCRNDYEVKATNIPNTGSYNWTVSHSEQLHSIRIGYDYDYEDYYSTAANICFGSCPTSTGDSTTDGESSGEIILPTTLFILLILVGLLF